MIVVLAGSLAGQTELYEIQQITTHPGMDFIPSVSPDGRWLAFVSDRSGNPDICVKALPRGPVYQITTHQAEDNQPVWSPDGKSLFFMSKRRDAFGDIWQVPLSFGKGRAAAASPPVPLTDYPGMDVSPCISPDGKHLAFVSDRSGTMNVWLVNPGNHGLMQVTHSGGMNPAVSPDGKWILYTALDSMHAGSLYLQSITGSENIRVTRPEIWDEQAAWSPEGDGILFVRYLYDTNGDGCVSPEDNGTIWLKWIHTDGDPERILQSPEIQLTSHLFHDAHVKWGRDGRAYFTSLRGGGLDIWCMPATGIFPRQDSAAEQYMLVLDRFGESVTPEGLYQAILGYQRVYDFFPQDSMQVAKALIQQANILLTLKEDSLAFMTIRYITERYQRFKVEVARARLLMATRSKIPIMSRFQICRDIIEEFANYPSIVAETRIVLGDLYREQGDFGKSLASYGRVVRSLTQRSHWRAQAQLRIGDLFLMQNDYETARQNFLAVLHEFGDVPLWRQRATERLLAGVSGTLPEKIQAYRNIIQEGRSVPSLVARAQLAIGSALLENGQFEEALRELEQVAFIVPGEAWAHARADMAMAEVFQKQGDALQGIFILEDVITKYALVEGGQYAREAETRLFDMLSESGERLKLQGDYALAASRFRRALTLRNDAIHVHRGWIESMFFSGKIHDVIRYYENQLARKSDDPLLLYGLGLALSYMGERDRDIIEESNEKIEQALAEDYRMVYPYQTLGFNYELMEKLAETESRKKTTILTRIGYVITAPVRLSANLLGLGGRGETRHYYEQAIDVLTTALELNDETRNPRLEAQLHQNLANNFYNLEEFGYIRAFDNYTRRMELDTTFVNPEQRAIFFERAGHTGLYSADYTHAGMFLKRAVHEFQELGRDDRALVSQRRLAMLHQFNKSYPEAVAVYEKILKQDEQANHSEQVMRDLRNIALNYMEMGEPEDAYKYALRAAQYFESHAPDIRPSRANQAHLQFLGLSLPIPFWKMEGIGGALAEGFTAADEALLVYGLASRSCDALKNFREAVYYEQKRLAIFRKRKDGLGERITLNRLGMLLYKAGDLSDAWTCFYQAYHQCVKAKDQKGRLASLANMSSAANMVRSGMNGILPAEKVFPFLAREIPLLADDSLYHDRDRMLMYNTLGTFLTLYADFDTSYGSGNMAGTRRVIRNEWQKIKRLADAETAFQKGLVMARNMGAWREEGVIEKNLSDALYRAGDISESIRHLLHAYQILRREGEEPLVWRVEYELARQLQQLNRNDRNRLGFDMDPLDLYKNAINRIENQPVMEENSETLWSDRAERWHVYLDYAFALAEKGMPEAALRIFEKGREKQIADMLARRPPDWKKERHKVIWGNVRYVRRELGRLRNAVLTEEEGENRYYVLEKLRKERREYENEHQELMHQIQNEDPVLAYLMGAADIDVAEMRSLLSDGMGGLVYAVDETRTLVWAVDQDTVICRILPYGRSRYEWEVKQFHTVLDNDSTDPAIPKRLSGLLTVPFSDFIGSKGHLVIVPDGPLWHIPFEFLQDGTELLADIVTTSYVPSLSFYLMAHDRKRINQERGLYAGSDVSSRLKKTMLNERPFNTFLTGADAKASAVRQAAATADLIHVQGHVTEQTINPLVSTIRFDSLNQTRFSTPVEEIFNWQFRSSLFLLDDPGRETDDTYVPLTVMMYALLYGGTPSVVMNRWVLPGQKADEMFTVFYENISQMSFSDALSEAQWHMRTGRSGTWDWCSFFLAGYNGMNRVQRYNYAEKNLVMQVLKGRAYEAQEDYSEAVAAYQDALDMAQTIGDTTGLIRIDNEIIRASMKGRLWPLAIGAQIDQLERSPTGRGPMMRGLNNLFVFYVQNRQFTEAVQTKQQMLETLAREGKMSEIGSAMEEIAFVFSQSRNFQEAMDWIDQARILYAQTDDSFGQARALLRKGRFLLDADQYWAANQVLTSGIEILKQAGPVVSKKDTLFELASGLQLRGLARERFHDYRNALEDQKEALAQFQRMQDKDQIGQGFQYLANLYWKMSRYREAVYCQEQAMRIFQDTDDRKRLAMAYSTEGLIHMSLGDTEKAISSEKKALDLASVEGGEADQAAILKNMGLIALRRNEFDDAYAYFNRAVILDSTIGHVPGLALDYRNLGKTLVEMGHVERGIRRLRQGLALSKERNDIRNTAHCYYEIGRAFQCQNRPVQAIAYLDSGLTVAGSIDIPELIWRLHRQKGMSLRQINRIPDALAEYNAAIRFIEEIRADLKVEAYQQGFLDDKMDLYTDMIDLMIMIGRKEDAYHYVERAKSRNFIDLLGNRDWAFSGDRGGWLGREKALQDSIQTATLRVKALSSLPERTESENRMLSEWTALLNERRRHYQDLLTEIQAQNPELASFVTVNPLTINEVSAGLPDSTGLLEYYLTPSSVHVWLITKEQQILKTIPVAADSVVGTVKRFRQAIQARLSSDREGVMLYNWLIRPFQNNLERLNHIVIIPHHVLHYLPFAALMDDGVYMMQSFSLSLAPSATVLAYSRNMGRMESKTGHVLAIGNPDLGDPGYALPFADKEIRSLERVFPHDAVVSFYADQATKSALIKNISGKQIIHFACHAEFEPEAPLFSALLLAPEDKNTGRLEVHEIFRLSLDADLVALSACETGLARITSGDDIIGLSRGFLFAGASSVMTSLWKVDDLATAVLMKRFYRYWLQGLSKAEALRRAQQIVYESVGQHPADWAAFYITGDFE